MTLQKGIVYRLIQKFRYHFSNDSFIKLVAEQNRFEKLIDLKNDNFKIAGSNLSFQKENHAFLLSNIKLFNRLNSSGRFSLEKENLIYEFDDIKFHLRTAEELFIASEVFFNKEYNFYLNKKELLVLDIGMNVGLASLFFASKENVKMVYSYELFPFTFDDGLKNFALNPQLSKKINPFPIGIGKRNEEKTLKYSFNTKGQNSIYENEGVSNVDVTIKDISEILNEISKHNLPVVVKMDCEGSEFEIFERLNETGIPDNIQFFMIEWHFKDPKEIISVLQKNGYSLIQNQQNKVGIIHAFKSN